MISNRNIICFANDWKNDPTSKHQIMKLLSRSNKIIWIDSVGLRNPKLGKRDIKRMFHKLISFFRGLEKVNDNFFVFTPIVVPFHHIRGVKKINSLILKWCLRHYIQKLSMKNIMYWSYLPNAGFIISQMDAAFILYHCVDEWSKFSFISDRIIEEEIALCRMSNLVITSAKSLYESKRPYNPNTHYVTHGVDYNYFHSARTQNKTLPTLMSEIPKPIAGFFGLIHEWIDQELLVYVMDRNANVSFVFIGDSSIDISTLRRRPNAYFLGQKRYEELVHYAKHFDIGLIPFKVNELTINVNPIKLREYLALGIPVVSVNLPEVELYRKVINIAEDYEAFDRALKNEISGIRRASFEEINKAARLETWEHKIEDISKLILETERSEGK